MYKHFTKPLIQYFTEFFVADLDVNHKFRKTDPAPANPPRFKGQLRFFVCSLSEANNQSENFFNSLLLAIAMIPADMWIYNSTPFQRNLIGRAYIVGQNYEDDGGPHQYEKGCLWVDEKIPVSWTAYPELNKITFFLEYYKL